MSGVSPSGSDVRSYLNEIQSEYQKKLDSLENEQSEELKRTEERQKAQVDHLESNYERSRADLSEEAARAVEETRKQGQDTLSKERELTKRELEEQSRLYNRNGKLRDTEVNAVKEQLKSSEKVWSQLHEKDRQALVDRDLQHSTRVAQLEKETEEQIADNMRKARENAYELYSKAFKDEQAKTQDYRRGLENRYNSLNRERVSELNSLKERNHAMEERNRDIERKAQRAGRDGENRLELALRDAARREEQSVSAATESLRLQNHDLRRMNSDLSSTSVQSRASEAEARSKAYSEIEQDFALKEAMLRESFEADINRLKRAVAQTEEHHGQMTAKNREESGRFYTNLIKQKQLEFQQELNDLRLSHESSMKQWSDRSKSQREQFDQKIELQASRANEVREAAMREQSEAYRGLFQRERENSGDRIGQLEKELQERRTTSNPTLISPAAEESVRKVISKEYEKTLAEERARNKRTVDSMQEQYQARMREEGDDSSLALRMTQKELTVSKNQDQARLANYAQEADFERQSAIRRHMDNQEKVLSRIDKTHQGEIVMKQRQYDESQDNLKIDMAARMSELREEADFQLRMAQRMSAARLNETVRQHEKQMAEQKELYEDQLAQLKHERDKIVESTQREKRLALEEQERTFRHQLKQMEVQNEEKQRYLAQSFEDRIDRLTRSNAKLIQKKS